MQATGFITGMTLSSDILIGNADKNLSDKAVHRLFGTMPDKGDPSDEELFAIFEIFATVRQNEKTLVLEPGLSHPETASEWERFTCWRRVLVYSHLPLA